jgi:hypothetical protein
MTSDIEDRLRRDLAAAVATPVRPAPDLASLERRARLGGPSRAPVPNAAISHLPGRRRLALVAVAAAIVVVVGTLGLKPWDRTTSASATSSCRDNYAAASGPGVADGLRYLPSAVPDGFHSYGAWATVERPCKPKRAALVLLDNPGGVVHRAVTVWGPDAADTDFFFGGQGQGGTPQTTVTVRGVAGRLQATGYGPRDRQTLGWTETGSGEHWIATSVGMSGDELAALAGVLQVTPGAASLAAPAARGFSQEATQPAAPVGAQAQWYVDYQPNAGPAPDADITIEVRRGDLLAGLSAGAPATRVTTTNGHPSVAFTQGTVSFLQVQIAPGVTAQLSGPLRVDQLGRLAADLQPVAANDPRIKVPQGVGPGPSK